MIAFADEIKSDLPERVREMFSPHGLLSKTRNFEYRPQQQEMAQAIAEALSSENSLVVEAGTGVGKSMAYLVPAVLYAVENDRKAVISTHTINLQEQLIYKDIPIVQKLLPIEFEAALLKGRQNYVCPQRLKRAMEQSDELFTSPEAEELKRIFEWSQKTTDGTLSDFQVEPDPKVWAMVCSEAHICTPKSCKESECFYQAARKKILNANVIVLNHTLFFLNLGSAADFQEEDSGFLFGNDFVIFDEAHTIESVAARQIGLAVSQFGLRTTLHRLYNPNTKKGLWQALRKGDQCRQTAEALETVDQFFKQAEENAKFGDRKEYRVREPEFLEDSVTSALTNLLTAVVDTVREIDDTLAKAELQDLGRKVRDARFGIIEFLRQESEDHVYWLEKSGKAGQYLSMNAAPVDLAAHLRRMLFRPGSSCIVTSATLSVGRPDLAYFRERVGALEVPAKQIGSPFDYERQMKLYIPREMPDPREKTFDAALEKWIRHFLELSDGRAFVLFTSFRTLQSLADRMRNWIEKKGWHFLAQGGGVPRHQMLQEFKEQDSVLFGTDSFWTGVDVPGERLSNVIITRLPFAVPDHPLIEARLEEIEQRGGDAFSEYSLPEAILKLRQGVGRLIRTTQDKGIVAILDNRVLSKPYGKSFLRALPKCPVEIL